MSWRRSQPIGKVSLTPEEHYLSDEGDLSYSNAAHPSEQLHLDWDAAGF